MTRKDEDEYEEEEYDDEYDDEDDEDEEDDSMTLEDVKNGLDVLDKGIDVWNKLTKQQTPYVPPPPPPQPIIKLPNIEKNKDDDPKHEIRHKELIKWAKVGIVVGGTIGLVTIIIQLI